jgi:prepilin-type N-terminal cleavage/methylation domain-containing protein
MRLPREIEYRKRTGFTLLEMMCVMAVLGILLMAGTGLIVTVMKTSSMGDRIGNRVSQRAELAKQFRDDVARAERARDKFGDLEAGPTVLILRMPDESTIIYRINDDGCTRIERKNLSETSRRLPLDAKNTTVEFTHPAGSSKLITMRITESPSRGPVNVTELSAALGGNSR